MSIAFNYYLNASQAVHPRDMNAVRDDLLTLEYPVYFVRVAQQIKHGSVLTDSSILRTGGKKDTTEHRPGDSVLWSSIERRRLLPRKNRSQR